MATSIIGDRPTKMTKGYKGEALVWDLLKAAAPADWTIWYEPYLARGESGSAARNPDFMVSAPGLGVLLLEVKGLTAGELTVENRTIWADYGDGDRKDLLKQVRGQAQRLRDTIAREAKLRDRFPYSSFNLAYALGFPFWSFAGSDGHQLRTAPEGWEKWNVIESLAFRDGDEFIARIAQVLTDQSRANQNLSAFSAADASTFVAWFNGVSHKGRTSYDPVLSLIARDLDDFTSEQVDAQNQASELDKYWLDSPPSVGKTFIATRRAIKEAYKSRRVGFLMERRTIADRIKKAVQAQMFEWGTEDVMSGPLPRLQITTVSSVLGGLYPAWRKQKDLDVIALSIVEAREAGRFKPFDVLVLDQAEDYLLNQPGMINVLAELVEGGLSGGKIKIFSDIIHQGHTNPEKQAALTEHLKMLGFVQVRTLTTNCRNAPPIARYLNKLLSGPDAVKQVYEKWLDDGDAYSEFSKPVLQNYPRTQWYPAWLTDESQRAGSLPPGWFQVQELANQLKKLRDFGVEPRNIAVLTAMPRTASGDWQDVMPAEWSSPAILQKKVWDWGSRIEGAIKDVFDPEKAMDISGLGPDWLPTDWKNDARVGGGVCWYTVEEFRGGEEQVIIITDLDQVLFRGVRNRHLISGVSRSKARLIVITNDLLAEFGPDAG